MSVGTYATPDLAKRRLLEAGIEDDSNDVLIVELCDQVNSWIESRTNRVLSPIPTYATTLTAQATAGTVTVLLAATTVALKVNDVLMFGPVTGAHESALVADVAGDLGTPLTVTLATPLAATYAASTPVKRVYVYDGFDRALSGRVLPIPRGIRAITSLEVIPVSAGEGGALPQGGTTWALLPRQDYFLRPVAQQRTPGFPATEVWITNIPTPGNSTPAFFPGFNNVRIDGLLGWPETPPEIVDIALTVLVTAFKARASSGGELVRINVDGSRSYERALSWQDRQTLDHYTLAAAETEII